MREPLLHQKRGWWHAVFYEGGTRRWKALGTRNRRDAEREAARRMRRYREEGVLPWDDPEALRTTLKEGVAEYLKQHAEVSRESSQKDMRRFLALVEAKLGPSTRMSDLTHDMVEPIIHSPTLRRATQQGYYRRTKAFLSWGQKEGYFARLDLGKVRRPRAEKSVPLFLSREELDRAIDYARREAPWMEPVIVLAVSTGLRLSELTGLTWADVEDGWLHVKGKGGRERRVPVFPMAKEMLSRLSPFGEYVLENARGGALNLFSVSRAFKACVRGAELDERYHFHTLRHTFASWLAMEGVPLDRIRDWMGHSSVKTTEVYAHLRPDAVRDQGAAAFS